MICKKNKVILLFSFIDLVIQVFVDHLLFAQALYKVLWDTVVNTTDLVPAFTQFTV